MSVVDWSSRPQTVKYLVPCAVGVSGEVREA